MRHRLQWLIYLWAQGLRKGDEHRPPTLLIGYGTLHFFNTAFGNADQKVRLKLGHSTLCLRKKRH